MRKDFPLTVGIFVFSTGALMNRGLLGLHGGEVRRGEEASRL